MNQQDSSITKPRSGINPSSFDWCRLRLRKGFQDLQIPVLETVDEEKSVVFVGEFQPQWEFSPKYPFRLKVAESTCRISVEILVDRNVEVNQRAAVAILCCCFNLNSNDTHHGFDPSDGETILTVSFDSESVFRSTAYLELKNIFSSVETNLIGFASALKDIHLGIDPCCAFITNICDDELEQPKNEFLPPNVFQYEVLGKLMDEKYWYAPNT